MSELEQKLRARISELEVQLEARGSAEPVAAAAVPDYKAQRDELVAVVKEAYFEGFGDQFTYNDIVLEDAESTWLKSEAKAAIAKHEGGA